MTRHARIAALVAAAASLVPVAASAAAPSTGAHVISGTVHYGNTLGTDLVLMDGTELVVPTTVNVLHTELGARRRIKAYYEDRDGRKVVTLLHLYERHPGG